MKQDEKIGKAREEVRWSGVLEVRPEDVPRAAAMVSRAWLGDVEVRDGKIHLLPYKNLVVDSGIQRSLDKLVGRNGPPGAVITMGVDDGVANPVAGTTSSSAGSTNRRLVSFDATPGRTGNVLTMDGTFTQANVAFIMKRLFLSAAAAGTTDVGGDLYSMTNVFTIDFTSFTTWSLTFTASVTGIGA